MVVPLMNSTTGTHLNRFQMIMTGVNKTSKVILEVTNFSLAKETPIQKWSLLLSFIVRSSKGQSRSQSLRYPYPAVTHSFCGLRSARYKVAQYENDMSSLLPKCTLSIHSRHSGNEVVTLMFTVTSAAETSTSLLHCTVTLRVSRS